MQQFLGVIIDVDGTLVDSNDAHAQAWLDVMIAQGYEIEFAEVRRLIGMGGDNLLPAALDVSKESDVGKHMSERRSEVFREQYLRDVRGFPETRALIERMRADDLQLIVASSAKTEELDPLLERANVKELLTERVSASDVQHSKPQPDAINAALDQMDLPPSAMVMLGDTPYDLEAASRAGVAMIALRCGGWDDDAFAGALAIYDDPADLLANYDSSPLGRKS